MAQTHRLKSKYSSEALRAGGISLPMAMAPPLPTHVSTRPPHGRNGSSDHSQNGNSSQRRESNNHGSNNGNRSTSGEKEATVASEKSSRASFKTRSTRSSSSAAAVGPPSFLAEMNESSKSSHHSKNGKDKDDDSASISSFKCSDALEFDRKAKILMAQPPSQKIVDSSKDATEVIKRWADDKQTWLDGLFIKLTEKGLKKVGMGGRARSDSQAALRGNFLDLTSVISPLPGMNFASSPSPPPSAASTTGSFASISPPRPGLPHHMMSADCIPTRGSLADRSAALAALATPGRARKHSFPRIVEQGRSQSSMAMHMITDVPEEPTTSLIRRASDRAVAEGGSERNSHGRHPHSRPALMTRKSMDRLNYADTDNSCSSTPKLAQQVPALPGWAKEINRHLSSTSMTRASTDNGQLRLQTHGTRVAMAAPSAAISMARTRSDSVQILPMPPSASDNHVRRPVLPARASSSSAQGSVSSAVRSPAFSNMDTSIAYGHGASRGSVSSVSTASSSSPKTPSSALPSGRLLYGSVDLDHSPFPPHPSHLCGNEGSHDIGMGPGAAGIGTHNPASSLMLAGVDMRSSKGDAESLSRLTGVDARQPLGLSRSINNPHATPRAGKGVIHGHGDDKRRALAGGLV